MYFSLFGSKEKYQKKSRPAPWSACGGLPSRNARTRGRQELTRLRRAQTACRPWTASARFARLRCNGFL